MYEKRRKHYPTFPKSLDEAIDQLKNLHEDFKCLYYIIILSACFLLFLI